jgi:hypothetical protein
MSAAGALTGGTSTATATAGEGTDGTEKRTTPKTLRHFGKCSSRESGIENQTLP